MTKLTGIAIYTEEQVIQALRNQLGNYDLASRELNVPRSQMMTFVANHPDTLEAVKQIKEGFKDLAEDLLVTKMKDDNGLLMFYLRTQAADRGYAPSTTLKGDAKNPLQVNVNARTLIAAMRNGFSDNESEEESDEVSDLFERSNFLPGDVGGGGTGEVP